MHISMLIMTPKNEIDARDEEDCSRDENVGVKRRCKDSMNKFCEEDKLSVSLLMRNDSEEADIDKKQSIIVSSFFGRLMSETNLGVPSFNYHPSRFRTHIPIRGFHTSQHKAFCYN